MPERPVCAQCGVLLTEDDVGASKKLINRGLPAEECVCVPCLASRFRVGETVIRDRIRYWRDQGCLLFAPDPEE